MRAVGEGDRDEPQLPQEGHSPSAPGGPAWPGGSPGSSARATLGAAALPGETGRHARVRGEHKPPPQGRSQRGALRCRDRELQPPPHFTPTLPSWGTGSQCSQCQAGENPGVLGLPSPPQAPYPASASCSGWRRTAPAAAPRSSSASRKLCLPREKTPRGSWGLRAPMWWGRRDPSLS